MLSLADTMKMEGNDFIIFKHGCGNDSTYHEPGTLEFDEWTKERFDKPCDDFTFYHVELEYVGDQSYIYKYEQPDNDDETDWHPENDSLLYFTFIYAPETLTKRGGTATLMAVNFYVQRLSF